MREPLFFEPVDKPTNRSIADGLIENITDASLDKEAFMQSGNLSPQQIAETKKACLHYLVN